MVALLLRNLVAAAEHPPFFYVSRLRGDPRLCESSSDSDPLAELCLRRRPKIRNFRSRESQKRSFFE
jgi:hypothetical protein